VGWARAAAVAVLCFPAIGMGEETKPWAAVVTVTSDYDYRGLSQTAESAAVQMDPSYTFRHMRADIFLSNVNFGEGSGSAFFGKRHTEIAYTLDFYGGTNDSLLYDIGISYFTYPGWNPNVSYPEAYITLSRKWLSTSIHYTWAYDNLRPRLPAYYAELNVTYPTGIWATNLILHAGGNWGDYWTVAYQGAYEDYAVGLAKSIAGIDLSLRFVGTRGYSVVAHGEPFSGERRIIASASIDL
jgi:uncharacterized protein (TIGR02001 family)